MELTYTVDHSACTQHWVQNETTLLHSEHLLAKNCFS